MSSRKSGQWRCFPGKSVFLRSLIAAVSVLFAPAAPIAQDSLEFFLPDLESDAYLMAELVEAEVAFVDPAGISETNDLRIDASGQGLAGVVRLAVLPHSSAGGTKQATVQPGTKTAASLTVAAPPGMPITIHVDEVVAGDGYSLADFRCNYNDGSDTACDGSGLSATTVASGTLLVGATLTGNENLMAGATDGSFEVTISYQ